MKKKSQSRNTNDVQYTQNYISLAIVGFDKKTVLIETLDEKQPKGSMKNAIVTTLDLRQTIRRSDRDGSMTAR
ncbi:MAG: murein transglycosylase domain-containing protein [Nitrospira sp.]|nr:murein transglycosylase domain-containing protein [Nitrospira sp.]